MDGVGQVPVQVPQRFRDGLGQALPGCARGAHARMHRRARARKQASTGTRKDASFKGEAAQPAFAAAVGVASFVEWRRNGARVRGRVVGENGGGSGQYCSLESDIPRPARAESARTLTKPNNSQTLAARRRAVAAIKCGWKSRKELL